MHVLDEIDGVLMAAFGTEPTAYRIDGHVLTLTSRAITPTFQREGR